MAGSEDGYVLQNWANGVIGISALTVWNSLPYSIKQSATSREHFQKEMKTYMFRNAYGPASENY